MKITLVLCPSWGIETPHLGIALLSANLRKNGFAVAVLDLNIRFHNRHKEEGLWKSEEDVHWEDPQSLNRFVQENSALLDSFADEILATGSEVIGFSVYSTTQRLSLELARRIKSKDKAKTIVCGGQMCYPQARAMSLIREESVDAVVLGEGDEVIVSLMRKMAESGKPDHCLGVLWKENGTVRSGGLAPAIADLDGLPCPDFSDFNLRDYGNPTQLPMLASRGCPYPCAFCNTKLFWGKHRSLSGERMFREVLHDLDLYPEVHFITLNDHTVNADMEAFSHFVDLATELKEKNGHLKKNYARLGWKGAAVIREEMTKELMERVKRSGCIELEYGVESASDKVRRIMRKPPKDMGTLERVIRDTAEAGIDVRANFMFGFPGETVEDFEQTLEFLRRNKDYFRQVHPSETFCHIDPDTYMYNHPQEFGITNFLTNSLYWESAEDLQNIYPERLRRHQVFCDLASSLNIPLSPGGLKIRLYKQHFLDEYFKYKERAAG